MVVGNFLLLWNLSIISFGLGRVEGEVSVVFWVVVGWGYRGTHQRQQQLQQ